MATGETLLDDPSGAVESINALLTRDHPLTLGEAVEVAVRLDDEDLFGLIRSDAEACRARLLDAWRYCPEGYEPGVLTALAVACWACGGGATMTETLTRLHRSAPDSPMLSLLAKLQLTSPHPAQTPRAE